MLRRNIDITMGLVNGAKGTVVGIYSTHVLIKCDLASENRPYDIFNPNGVISIML